MPFTGPPSHTIDPYLSSNFYLRLFYYRDQYSPEGFLSYESGNIVLINLFLFLMEMNSFSKRK